PTPAPDVPGLVERLRSRAARPPSSYKTTFDITEAADALEALQAEVARVQAKYDRERHAADEYEARATAAEAERDAQRSKVEELSVELAYCERRLDADYQREGVADLIAERDALKAEVGRLRKADRACQWYWPENSTESENCADSPQEVVQNAYGWEEPRGDVVAVARGGVVEVTYCAALPPAPDSDSDDEFWVEEATEEAAASKITAELERRAALSPAKAGG
ncbi:MAG: hypothetical protein ABFE07_06410, partial [Armatimonadia bacterium]